MHVAYLSIGMSGALFSSFELSRRLVAAGHQITYLSQAPIAAQVRAQGHDFVALTQDQEIRRRSAAAQGLKARRALHLESVSGHELRQTLRSLKPDVLLIDIEMHLAVVTTASLNIPTALFMVWFSVFRRPGIPPMNRPGLPDSSPLGRTKIALQWWRLRLETLHMYWRGRLGRWRRGDLWPPLFYDSVDVHLLHGAARRNRFNLRRQTSRAHWLRPWLYTRLPILSCTPAELDYPEAGDTKPENLFYVGPLVHRRRRPTPKTLPCHELWRRFKASRDGQGCEPKPLVYASLGTYWSADVELLGRIVEVFRRRTDWHLVLGLGGKLESLRLGDLPDNVLALDFAPQAEVLADADAAILHGGIGTLNECLLCEVPMVVYSTGFVDQDGCAARLDFYGLGLLGNKTTDDSRRIEELLSRALQDDDMRQRLRTAAHRCSYYERARPGVRLLEGLAAGKKAADLESLWSPDAISSMDPGGKHSGPSNDGSSGERI